MKNIYFIMALMFLLTSVLQLSSQEKIDEPWKVNCCDGYFYATSAKPMTQGWSPFVEFSVVNSEIRNLRFDKIKKGKLASEDKFYNSLMKKKSGINPAEYSKIIPDTFMKARDADKMDAVAGATQSAQEFKVLMNFLLKKGEEGIPGKFQVDNKLLEHK